jgi:hypothetical protein
MDCRVASLLANEHVFVVTSLAPPGVVIQLDGHGAERLAMTFSGFIAAITQAAALAAGSRNDKNLKPIGTSVHETVFRLRRAAKTAA